MLIGLGSASLAGQTAQGIAGTWQGTMQDRHGMRIVVKISKGDGAGGGWKGELYNIDSGNASAVPTITLAGADVKFAIASIEANYEGR